MENGRPENALRIIIQYLTRRFDNNYCNAFRRTKNIVSREAHSIKQYKLFDTYKKKCNIIVIVCVYIAYYITDYNVKQ